nr:reverse transcriptase domain-containing protein [Tanacetum cinerariifolium]
MKVNIEEDKNEPKFTYPYEEVGPLNPPPPTSESKPEDATEVENTIDHEDETVPASVHEIGNEARSNVEQGMATMEKLVERLGNVEEKAEIMPLKSTPLSQDAIRRMIKESVDAAITAERARHANARNDARGSGPVRGAVKLQRWFEKTESIFRISECAEGKKVKFAAATLQGPDLTWWNAKVATMGLETVNKIPWTEMKQLMTLMEQKSQARDERILKGKNQKWENYQSGNSSGKSNHKDNSRQTLQNNQKQGNARAMVTAPTDGNVSFGSLPLCERCFTRHVGPCMIKCHKCGKVGHKARSFVDTRFSSMLNIDPVKIKASYEVELAYGRVVSTNTILKGCTLNLVNHIFEIDLMLIELGTFDVIIGMDWLVNHDAVIVCGEKVVRIPYKDKMLGNVEEKAECKKLKKELEKARVMPSKSAPFTQATMHRMIKESVDAAIAAERARHANARNDARRSGPSAPFTQATMHRMIKESVDAAIAAERARHANARNDARGSGPVRGQVAAPAVRECTFDEFMKCNPTAFHEGKKVKFVAATFQGHSLTWWNAKVTTMGLETVNQMPWSGIKQLMPAEFCPVEEIKE